MAGIDINVLLREGSGKAGVSQSMSRAKSKLSAKDTATLSKTMKKAGNTLSGMTTFASTGSIPKSFAMSVPVLREIKIATMVADKGVDFGSKLYQAHTGEDMLISNFKAKYKTVTTAGANLIEGYVKNLLYNRPVVRRQNNMLDYGREIYLRNVESEKNQFV
jgi:hypothetical protein